MKIKTSRCLSIKPTSDGCEIYNFLTGYAVTAKKGAIELLFSATDPISATDLAQKFPSLSGETLADMVAKFLAAGVLIGSDSPQDKLEKQYSEKWEWGDIAAHFHFGIKDTPYLQPEEERTWLKSRSDERKTPELFSEIQIKENKIKLKEFEIDTHLRETMYDRRSERRFSQRSVDLDVISDCLFSGLGIVGFYDEPIYGRLPLKMAPSGGARNPYEGYLLVQRVNGLKPGIYHYSAVENALELVNKSVPVLGKVIGGQEWANEAAAMILLVANLDRDMWKYPHPAAYRPVLIEAGHIGQNILLTATDHGLSCCPTAALSDSYIDQYIARDFLLQAPTYTVSIGYAQDEYSSWYDSRPNRLGSFPTSDG